MRRFEDQSGFTLIELMIAGLIMAVLSVAIATGFEGQKTFYNSNERVVEAQEHARLVLDLIKFDTRMAGFMVAPVASVSSVDGGTGATDRFCVSTTAGFDLPTAGELTSLGNQIERYLVNDTNVTTIPGHRRHTSKHHHLLL